MPDIVLTTLNAKYIHTAFGLRYLLANLGDLQPRACLVEFDINQRPLDIAEVLLAREPKILGFGVYIWNVAETTKVIAALKRVRPELIIILGGPEVSYETETQDIFSLADHVITGEADLTFGEVCRHLLAGGKPPARIIPAPLPEFSRLVLPYDLYTDDDIAHRVIYVEASRGCPFTCEFCLSSLDIPVRQAPLDLLLGHLQRLLDRGVTQFKFVDRTFNLNLHTSRALLQFFLDRYRPGLFFHFEMIPDRLPEALRGLIGKFPPGSLQFEVGVQSFNEEVCRLISRRQDLRKLEDNFTYLRAETGVHIHADLIVGLPGEDVASLASGFDRLVRLGPQEIQVGILKRLRGTPIIRHDEEWQMRYHPQPPYEILQHKLIDFGMMQRLRRFAKYWDLVGNSGNFVETAPLLWSLATPPSRLSPLPGEQVSSLSTPALSSPTVSIVKTQPHDSEIFGPGRMPVLPEETGRPSAFAGFLRFADWLHLQAGRTDGIALSRLAELLFRYLTGEAGVGQEQVAATLRRDWQRGGRRDPPEFLRPFLREALTEPSTSQRRRSSGPTRQARHQGVSG